MLAVLTLGAPPAQALDIDWVQIGTPNNFGDNTGFGAVDVVYEIGAFEVTNLEYTVFLSAVARSDPNELYTPSMDIVRVGGDGSYRYQALDPDAPVAYVSLYDSLRFANWLHNGQPSGPQSAATTEDGAYTLLGSNPASVSRNPGARVFLAGEHEWYKAAYWSPLLPGYFSYPTGTYEHTVCTMAPDATENRANCDDTGSVPVGSYTGSPSPLGTFDQGGNLWERVDGAVATNGHIRGGAFNDGGPQFMLATASSFVPAGTEINFVGFRVARILPPFVVVGDPGNDDDDTGHGAVDYVYEIATTEVTKREYTEFLNAVAATDPNGLYHSSMAIDQIGSSGSFTYETQQSVPFFADEAVAYVSIFDAMRFANWLHNGRPSGAQGETTTEDGAYTLGGAPGSETRNPDARYFIPSEDEWYKAAYYDASLAGGTGGYYEYPTRSDTEPACSPPTFGSNAANCFGRAGNRPRLVGSYNYSAGPWGTFDQAGSVFEWVDQRVDASRHMTRGGDFQNTAPLTRSSSFARRTSTTELRSGGFRVARLPARWVAVGDPGNACGNNCFGSVPYPYEIGRTEVPNAEYVELLNAVAASDPNALYDPLMRIGRNGSSGSYTYFTDRPHDPVAYTSLFSAMRFANWLHNGKPVAAQSPVTTEGGAYTITSAGISTNSIDRNPGARFGVPSRDEWYKAASYDPSLDAGFGDYYDYPTRTDTTPTCAAPGTTPNTSNCDLAVSRPTTIGGYTGSPGPWGTFDQSGNVGEWSEARVNPASSAVYGGDWANPLLDAASPILIDPASQTAVIGFRIVRIPEPHAGALAATALLMIAALRRRGWGGQPKVGVGTL
jgi:formylglycine-generating enzyme required for sulfatase activity